MAVFTFHPSYAGSINRKVMVQATQGMHVRPFPKITKVKRARFVAQEVECLLSKYEAQCTNPYIVKTKNKRILHSLRFQ
jgi:hypothetical protein